MYTYKYGVEFLSLKESPQWQKFTQDAPVYSQTIQRYPSFGLSLNYKNPQTFAVKELSGEFIPGSVIGL